MSLIGIDVGSTGTKLSAYNSEGRSLGSVYAAHTPHHPFPGAWELDPEEIWINCMNGLRQLVSTESLLRDPPLVIAISASTREGFPVDASGKALGPCIMTADTRESGLEQSISSHYKPDEWFAFCGHMPERMDPVCRLLWWKKNHPGVIAKAKYFVGWGEYMNLRLAGQAVVDRSHAGRFLIYDFNTHQWSPERISEFEIDQDILPEIRPWGAIIGELRTDVWTSLGLKNQVQVAVGANDAVCCVLGAGVSNVGTGCLISGSWENLLLPVHTQPAASTLMDAGVSIGPYPGEASWMIYCLSPTGSAALNWVRDLVNVKVEEMETSLRNSDRGPGHVLAIPHVSGATVPWVGGSELRAALLGMTLATTPTDIVKAVMESIVYDMSYLIVALKKGGAKIDMLRGIGGGTRSEWWTQLKADLTRTVIETVDQPELGTLGAAILAGKALGIWNDIEGRAAAFTKANRGYEPSLRRASLYEKRMGFYHSLINEWLEKDWDQMKA